MYAKIILFALIIVLAGCGRRVESYRPVIIAEILKNAAGENIKPEIDSLVLVNTYTVAQVTDYWIAKERCGGNIDTLINHLQNIKMDNDHGQFNWLKWEKNRVRELKANDKKSVLYDVVKVNYTVEQLANKTKYSGKLYYIIHNSMVVGTTLEKDLKNTTNIGGNPIFAYEYIQFKFENPDLQ